MQVPAAQVLVFDSFRLDVAERTLTMRGSAVPLPPKAFDLLVLLASRAGHLTDKSTVLRCLWPDTFVEEANLANYVSLLRKTLGKAPDGRDYIETVPRKGYRFRAAGHGSPDAASYSAPIRSLAVLPFTALDSSTEAEAFADGMTEELTNEFAQVEGLRVAASTGVWPVRGAVVDVDALIEGSIRQHAGTVRITVQLIRASDGCHTWSRAYDRGLGDWLAIQREVGHAVASEIGARFLGLPAPHARRPVRLIVLPFRVLRADDTIEFLRRSLAESVACDLARHDSVVVRSSLVAERWIDSVPDFRELAAVADVDMLLTGSLLRSGDTLHYETELIALPDGVLRWSTAAEVRLEDMRLVRDTILRGVAGVLGPEVTVDDRARLSRETPATCRAYEFYLRANELIRKRSVENFAVARDLYRECLADDPNYAPAWARLGRCYRFLSKFAGADGNLTALASEALEKALRLDPDLPLAHNVYALLEADLGRACEVMTDLLRRAQTRPHDPELFAGLVHACRFAGLLSESVRAHELARQLDPNIITSVEHTHFLMGQYGAALATYPTRSGFYMDAATLALLGREEDALRTLRARHNTNISSGSVQALMDSLELLLLGDRASAVPILQDAIPAATRLRDLESLFYITRQLAHLGEATEAARQIQWLTANGFCAAVPLVSDPWLRLLHDQPDYDALLDSARRLEESNRRAFLGADGPAILGGTNS